MAGGCRWGRRIPRRSLGSWTDWPTASESLLCVVQRDLGTSARPSRSTSFSGMVKQSRSLKRVGRDGAERVRSEVVITG